MNNTNNLYVLHTQYNLIIGLACLKARGSLQNDLILHAEFPVTTDIINRLESVFRHVWIVQKERFSGNPIQNELHLHSMIKKLSFLNETYDNVFIAEEEYFDTYIYKRAREINPKCRMCCIEEDVYYSPVQAYNTLEYYQAFKHKKRLPDLLQNAVRTVLYGKNPYFEEKFFYGDNSHFAELNVNFPNALRPQLKTKKTIHEVDPNHIVWAICTLYGEGKLEDFSGEKYVLILFDLISRYSDRQAIEAFLAQLDQMPIGDNVQLLYKYHPMETDSFDTLSGSAKMKELDSKVPSEKYLYDLKDKKVCVIGNASYSILLAKKIGFHAVTISKILNSCNEGMENAYSSIGIQMPNTYEEMLSTIEECLK